MIIDFHTHIFPRSISLKTMEYLSGNGHIKYFTDGTPEALAVMMRRNGVSYAVNMPVMTKPEQVTRVNDSLIEQREKLLKDGIITFGGLHPAFGDYRAEIKKLKNAGLKGVKLHPAFQGVHINDLAYKRIIGAVSEAGLITLIHSGWDIGFMDRNYASVPELLDVIEDVRPEKLVLAHMGNCHAWDEAEEYLAGAPVWLDTSFSLGRLHPRAGDEALIPFRENLTSEGFARLVRKHGADRVLFATDCPWSDQRDYIEFLNQTELSEKEKSRIFSENALSLLNFDG